MNVTWKKIIASRGWHVYGKDKWQNPKKGEQLRVEIEKDPKALQFDPHSVAWMKKSRAKLTPDVVGHFPMEVSRFVFFFIKHGGAVSGKVAREKYLPSPIPKGGLEIAVEAEFSIEATKKDLLTRLIKLIDENYKSPDGEVEVEVAEVESDLVPDDENDEDIIIVLDGEVEADESDIDMIVHS